MRAQPARSGMDEPGVYQIRAQGRIGQEWIGCFEEMRITVEDGDGGTITTLSGMVTDQAALHGLLDKLYTLGLVLRQVSRLPG